MVEIRAPDHAQARPEPDLPRAELVLGGGSDHNHGGPVAEERELPRPAPAQLGPVVNDVGS